MDTTQQKINALAAHTGTDPEDIEQSDYDDLVFDADGTDYLVCDDDEATARAGDYIKDSLWAFNAEFIIDHSELPYESKEMITSFQADKCEDANDDIETMISDMDEFIEDAISADGRGHFLNYWDGEEYGEGEFYIYQM